MSNLARYKIGMPKGHLAKSTEMPFFILSDSSFFPRNFDIFNPRRACAARATVVVVFVCHSFIYSFQS